MISLLILAAVGGVVSAVTPDRRQICGPYFVVHYPERVRYLDILSASRGLSASGRELKLRKVMASLTKDAPYAVQPTARTPYPADRVDLKAFGAAARLSLHMRWRAGASITKEVVIGPDDSRSGDVTLDVHRREDRSYEVSFGPDVGPLYRDRTDVVHLMAGPRQIVIWHFGAGGELRRIGLRVVTPRNLGAPDVQESMFDVQDRPSVR